MGSLFPDSPEFPDYRPIPSVVMAAAAHGVLDLLVVALITQLMPPAARLVSNGPTRLVPPVGGFGSLRNRGAFEVLEFAEESPHPHNETAGQVRSDALDPARQRGLALARSASRERRSTATG